MMLLAAIILVCAVTARALLAESRCAVARRDVARLSDAVAEAACSIQTGDIGRLTAARVALDNLVAPYYHAGLPPYRQVAAKASPCDADNRYRHALEAISVLRGETSSGDAALHTAREIAKKALAG
jgi:hypothetical protein